MQLPENTIARPTLTVTHSWRLYNPPSYGRPHLLLSKSRQLRLLKIFSKVNHLANLVVGSTAQTHVLGFLLNFQIIFPKMSIISSLLSNEWVAAQPKLLIMVVTS